MVLNMLTRKQVRVKTIRSFNSRIWEPTAEWDKEWAHQIEKGKSRWSRKERIPREPRPEFDSLKSNEPAFHTSADRKNQEDRKETFVPQRGGGKMLLRGSEEQRTQTHAQHPTRRPWGIWEPAWDRWKDPKRRNRLRANRGAEWTAT